MRPGTLLTQVLLVNLLLIASAVLAAAIASNPDRSAIDADTTGLVLGFALALTVTVNVFLLARRIRPLERLADEMESAELTGPGRSEPWPSGGPEEVRRLQESFRAMLERLEAERRDSAGAALAAQERERARVALDLHDEVNQALTGLLLRLEALRAKAPPELSAELSETREVAGSAMRELLALARRLRPTALDDLGLKAALAELSEEAGRQSGIETVFECEGDPGELPDRVSLVSYRVAQEALSNALRHAGAARVRIRLRCSRHELELRISDDGAGFAADAVGEGLGLAGMRERALLVGGRLEVESAPGKGTRVRLIIDPIEEGSR
jgi:two-component system, NarL family, sensor histidine kinase UhpB